MLYLVLVLILHFSLVAPITPTPANERKKERTIYPFASWREEGRLHAIHINEAIMVPLMDLIQVDNEMPYNSLNFSILLIYSTYLHYLDPDVRS